MKQVISIADFATMLNVINDRIEEIERQIAYTIPFNIKEEKDTFLKLKTESLKHNQHYQSLLHAKKALEECKVEIKVPDLEVKDERN